MIRMLCRLLVCLVAATPALAEVTLYPARIADPRRLVIYSTLDSRLAAPLIATFQARNPDVAVHYEDLLASKIATRIIAETDAGQATADFVFSSGMDLQLKLANDGYGQPVSVAMARDWPNWAKWQDTAFALTYEPAVLVYHKPSFPDGPPLSRLDLLDWLARAPASLTGRIGTYDIARSAVGYLFIARDAEHFPDIWSLLGAMGRAGLQTFATSQDIIDRVADGRLVLGYNILGSYAAEEARLAPDIGYVLLRDYTVVVSRVAMVPRRAPTPDLGRAFLAFLMSAEGQTLIAETLSLPVVALPPTGPDGGQQTLAGSGAAMQAALGPQVRPIPVSPGVLAYLDQAKRQRLLRLWREALVAD